MRTSGTKQPVKGLEKTCRKALEMLEARGFRRGEARILAVSPFFSVNPYQRMLYADAGSHGFAVVPVEDIADLEAVPADVPVVIHHHWIHDIVSGHRWARQARAAAGMFLEAASRQQALGRQLVWTIHNIMAHTSEFPEVEQELRQALAAQADHIHVMNKDTISLVAPHYSVDPEKVFRIPHASYKGVYADYISRDQARVSLGLGRGEKLLLLFGAQAPYKGTDMFLEQFPEIARTLEGSVCAVIAGKGGKTPYVKALRKQAKGMQNVQLHLSRVQEQDIQTYFRAADVAVCAHRGGLNTGVAATALTFGCPVVISKHLTGSLAEAEDLLFPFDPDQPQNLAAACATAYAAIGPKFEANARQWSADWAPKMASARFFEALEERLQWGSGG